MTAEILLPALRPTHPVGYLAALGLHRVLSNVADATARLAWTEDATAHAVLRTSLSLDAIVESVAAVWREQIHHSAVVRLPMEEGDGAFPPREPLDTTGARDGGKRGRGMNDAAKMVPWEFERWANAASAAEAPDALEWVRAVASDIVLDADRQPAIAALTDLYLLSRQQRLSQQFEALWGWAAKNDIEQALRECFTTWRRESAGGGMNWDIGSNQNAAETPDGSPVTAVVPGATWLAMMALPHFPVAGSAGRRRTRGFTYVKRGRQLLPTLTMPCWRPWLDVTAIGTLIDHPLLEPDAADDVPTVLGPKLGALGVSAVYRVGIIRRRVGGQTEAYLDRPERILGVSAPHGVAPPLPPPAQQSTSAFGSVDRPVGTRP